MTNQRFINYLFMLTGNSFDYRRSNVTSYRQKLQERVIEFGKRVTSYKVTFLDYHVKERDDKY